jgi:hypothetical protein
VTLPQRDADRIARQVALKAALELTIANGDCRGDKVIENSSKFLAFLNNTTTVEQHLVRFANWFQDNRTRTLGKDFSVIVEEYLEATE